MGRLVSRTYDELFEPQAWHLTLERESERFWIVVDNANPYEGEPAVMIRTPSWETAVRFMEAFCDRTPGATMEALHSWRVAQAQSNVYPIRMHEPLDEGVA